jgi:hypothetical protein
MIDITEKYKERGLALKDALNLLDDARLAGIKVEDITCIFSGMKESALIFGL